jgi:hypothetical protein
MEKNSDLLTVLKEEADLAEALVDVLHEKQRSLVNFHGDEIGVLSLREEALMKPFKDLELERERMVSDLSTQVGVENYADGKPATLRSLLSRVEGLDALRIGGEADRLRKAAETIVNLNAQNRVLLQHSLRFVRETLKIITENHTRQLLDHRV